MTINVSGKPEGCKLIRLDAEIAAGLVLKIDIRGDFFAIPEETFDSVLSALTKLPIDLFADRFDSAMAEAGVILQGISGKAVADLIKGYLNGLSA